MDALSSFFSMGGYGGFIWPSYGLAAIILIGLVVRSRATLRRDEILLAQLRAIRRGEADD
ncbi:MAG: heme exporter protein CcmD [Proteobacteria bacterium]|nr:heme exporter protein CcmD [Pseudomonadota bacterium]